MSSNTSAAVLVASSFLAGAIFGVLWQHGGDALWSQRGKVAVHAGSAAANDGAPAVVLTEPDATDARLAAALDGEGVVLRRNFDDLLSGSTPVGGQVNKSGMLPLELWQHTSDDDSPSIPMHCILGSCDPRMSQAAYGWLWDQVRGENGGIVSRLPLGKVPPKAELCTMLFSPVYKVAFSRSTKVGGTSVMHAMGYLCSGIHIDDPDNTMSWEELQSAGLCLVTNKEMQKFGLKRLGYETWEDLWADYTVFAIVRNPYDRAGSAHDYINKKGKTGTCEPASFEQFCARPYICGVQNTLFDCGNAIHDFYHVEPQAPCLVDGQGGFAVDYIVRLEDVEEDFAGLVDLINGRRAHRLPKVVNDIGWERRGPLVQAGEREANRHLAKFEACGAQCFDLVRNYYRADFALLGYATTEPEGAVAPADVDAAAAGDV